MAPSAASPRTSIAPASSPTCPSSATRSKTPAAPTPRRWPIAATAGRTPSAAGCWTRSSIAGGHRKRLLDGRRRQTLLLSAEQAHEQPQDRLARRPLPRRRAVQLAAHHVRQPLDLPRAEAPLWRAL